MDDARGGDAPPGGDSFAALGRLQATAARSPWGGFAPPMSVAASRASRGSHGSRRVRAVATAIGKGGDGEQRAQEVEDDAKAFEARMAKMETLFVSIDGSLAKLLELQRAAKEAADARRDADAYARALQGTLRRSMMLHTPIRLLHTAGGVLFAVLIFLIALFMRDALMDLFRFVGGSDATARLAGGVFAIVATAVSVYVLMVINVRQHRRAALAFALKHLPALQKEHPSAFAPPAARQPTTTLFAGRRGPASAVDVSADSEDDDDDGHGAGTGAKASAHRVESDVAYLCCSGAGALERRAMDQGGPEFVKRVLQVSDEVVAERSLNSI